MASCSGSRRRADPVALRNCVVDVWAILAGHDLNRLDHLGGPTGGWSAAVSAKSGELVNLDAKKVGQIQPDGCWRVRSRFGREPEQPG